MARTKVQTFEYREIQRTQITPAPYNPRRLDAEGERRLAENLQRVGLLTTLVWNERTGHLVGGHQRLLTLDALEGSTDYALGVAVIDVDEQRERELNVFLNNTWAQGEYDVDKLMALVSDCGGSADVVAAMGFTPAEMLLEFGSRTELAALMPAAAPRARTTTQDTLGPHVMLVFRSNADKQQFLGRLDRPEGLMRMGADELAEYLRGDARWRNPAA
jgi:hypothetical protein